jgi:hypothetical protein
VRYEFIPVHKEVIRYRERVWQPYAGVSYNTLRHATLSAGTFDHNLGVDFESTCAAGKRGCGVGVKYRFN